MVQNAGLRRPLDFPVPKSYGRFNGVSALQVLLSTTSVARTSCVFCTHFEVSCSICMLALSVVLLQPCCKPLAEATMDAQKKAATIPFLLASLISLTYHLTVCLMQVTQVTLSKAQRKSFTGHIKRPVLSRKSSS